MKTVILAAVVALAMSGCDYEKERVTTKCHETYDGGYECETKFYSGAVITCRSFEDSSQQCLATNMDIDEVVAIYDSEEAVIDTTDNEVIVEYPDNNNMIIIEVVK